MHWSQNVDHPSNTWPEQTEYSQHPSRQDIGAVVLGSADRVTHSRVIQLLLRLSDPREIQLVPPNQYLTSAKFDGHHPKCRLEHQLNEISRAGPGRAGPAFIAVYNSAMWTWSETAWMSGCLTVMCTEYWDIGRFKLIRSINALLFIIARASYLYCVLNSSFTSLYRLGSWRTRDDWLLRSFVDFIRIVNVAAINDMLDRSVAMWSRSQRSQCDDKFHWLEDQIKSINFAVNRQFVLQWRDERDEDQL